MKIFIKKNRWFVDFDSIALVFDIDKNDNIYTLHFKYGDKKLNITSNNIDKTMKYLNNLFNNKLTQKAG